MVALRSGIFAVTIYKLLQNSINCLVNYPFVRKPFSEDAPKIIRIKMQQLSAMTKHIDIYANPTVHALLIQVCIFLII